MLKIFSPLLFVTLLSSNTLTISPKVVSLGEAFTIESNNSIFDDTLSYTHKNLLSCQPALRAVYKVESDTKLKVIPQKSLPSGTEYACRYQEQEFGFATEPFALNGYHYFKKEKLLRLSFNDEMNIKSLKQHIKLYKKERLATTSLNYTVTQRNSKTVLLKINEPVNNHAIELRIEKSLASLNREELAENISVTFNEEPSTPPLKLNEGKEAMVIEDAPQMVALESGEFAVRIFLDDTLEGSPEKFISIEGVEDFRLDSDNYTTQEMRKELHVSQSAYYYTDVISSEFEPDTTYNITLHKGFENYHELKADKHYTLKTGDRAKSIIFDKKKPYISNQGELGFKSINIDQVTLIVERVLDDNLRYFMNFEGADRKEVQRYLTQIYTKEMSLDNPKNEITKQKLRLQDIATDLPFGVYQFTLRYADGSKEKSRSQILFLSNLGIAVNLSTDRAFITVLSLDKAQPISSAKVELFGENNELLGMSKTDEHGVTIISKKSLLDKKPKGIVVSHNNDRNFLSLNETIDSPTPEKVLKEAERFKAHIYFQSKLVRPAGRVNALLTIKDRDFISASKLPIKIVLQKRYAEVMSQKVYHTDEYGLINYSYQMEHVDRTGTYDLVATLGETTIGEASFKVEAFMPPKIENSIHLNQEIYRAGELIEANISSRYLFGAPASKLQGKVAIYSQSVEFEHQDYKNYSFINQNIKEENSDGYWSHEEDIVLDGDGRLSVALASNIKSKVPSILSAMMEVTIMDDTQPVSAYKKFMLYPYKHLVGVKLDQTHFEKGKALEGRAVLIDPMSGKRVEGELYVTIKKLNWHYSYSDGAYEWDREMVTVERFKLNSNEKFSRTIRENGDYIIEIHDRLGGHSATASFDVWWYEYSNISPNNDLKSVEIDFEERLYQKGDTLEVTIKSPILKGELYITLEGDRVESYQHQHIDKGVAKISIPIKHKLQRGAYLHATVYRASDTSSELIPFRAMGYKFVKPNRDANKIEVKLTIADESKSKTKLKIGVNTDQKSKLLISVVDTGILQLARQEKPKIFDFFNEQPEKKLSYYDLYDQLMSYLAEGKLIDFGAGDMMNQKQKHLPPDLDERIKPFMIWSGIIESTGNQHSLEIDVPEFNGKATIIAIAINENRLGVASKEVVIKDDIMIKPSYPKYLLRGDSVEVPIRLFNTTKEPKEITMSQTNSTHFDFEIGEKSLTLPANSSKVILAKLKATELGSGEIVLEAKFDGEVVSRTMHLTTLSPYALSTKTFKGISSQKVSLEIPKAYLNAKVYLHISDNLLGSMRDDLKYLVGYPYGCAEQTSSQILAMHHAKRFFKEDKLVGESENFIRQGIKKLKKMQNEYGEFSYWEGGSTANAYASLYTAQTLLELHRDGIEIGKNTISNMVEMLQTIAGGEPNFSTTYSKFHAIYAAYILTQEKQLPQSTLNMLLEKKIYEKHFLSTLYMAAILKMEGREDEATKIYHSIPHELDAYQQKSYSNRSGNFESNKRDMFLHFIIKREYFDANSKDLIVVQQSLNDLYSTQEKAIALKAISLYLGKPKKSKLDVKLEIDGKTERISKTTTRVIERMGGDKIILTPQSSAMSYSIELVKHLPKSPKNQLSPTKKLSIMREFIDEQNQTVDLGALEQGDKIYSQVTIANIGKINNVVISQRIPACLSIVNSNITSDTQGFKDKNIDQEHREIRDDRVLHFVNLAKKESYDRVSDLHRTIQNRGVLFVPLVVTTKGECQLPAVITEAMYDSQISDYAKERDTIIVGSSALHKP
jgi:uncharacterized protein YfaS (alpha-2-macroglobulin family)